MPSSLSDKEELLILILNATLIFISNLYYTKQLAKFRLSSHQWSLLRSNLVLRLFVNVLDEIGKNWLKF